MLLLHAGGVLLLFLVTFLLGSSSCLVFSELGVPQSLVNLVTRYYSSRYERILLPVINSIYIIFCLNEWNMD
jgi:hypothetical protein